MTWQLSNHLNASVSTGFGALAAVATVLLALPSYAQPGVAADRAKPPTVTTVQVISGCQGTAQLTAPLTAKTYRVSATLVSSGWLMSDRGDGLTQRSALEPAQNLNICDELLFRDLVRQVAQEEGWEPTDGVRNGQRINEIGQYSELLDRQPIQLVTLPKGQQRPFTIATLGSSKYQTADVAIIKVDLLPGQPPLACH